MKITTTDEKNRHKRELFLDDGTCVSRLIIYDLEMRIGGTPVSMAGIGDVYTHCQHRNMGYMRMLYEDTISYMKNQDYCVSALFGIENFYNKWNYASSLANYLGKVYTRDAETAKEFVKNAIIRPIEPEDMAAIVNLYNTNNATRSGSIARSKENFTKFSRWAEWGKIPAVLWEDKQHNLLGYAVLVEDKKAVRVSEVEAVEDNLYPTILHFLAMQGVEKRCESINMKLPPDHPFTEYTQRYGVEWEMNYPRYGSGMMRIINQTALFNKITPELERRLACSPLCGYSGSLTIQTDLSTTHLGIHQGHVIMATDSSGALKLFCPQDKLMQLLVGYRSVRDIVNGNEVQTNGDVIPLLTVLFPKGIPYMYVADHF